MTREITRKTAAAFLAGILLCTAGCSAKAEVSDTAEETESIEETTETVTVNYTQDTVVSTADVTSSGQLDASEFFTDRDLTQTADLSGAQYISAVSGQDITISSEGVYVISGTAEEVTIRVQAADSDKVQIVLNGVNITNSGSPVIYVISADKVFVTTTETENTLTVSGTFTADGTTSTDAVIFSKQDLVLNGLGTLNISSSDNGIACKDDLKITGGTIRISCTNDALEANDSIRISGGNITISSKKDGLHAEDDEDNTAGFIYICGGTLDITASDDGIHATTVAQIDGGSVSVNAGEGIEATYVQINGGKISISASDDGINAAWKSSWSTPTLEITGGELTVNMGAGDTDALDSNGNLIISGGTVDISANFAFDFDGTVSFTGGTVYVNGSQVTSITNSMMGGGMPFGGGFGGPGGH